MDPPPTALVQEANIEGNSCCFSGCHLSIWQKVSQQIASEFSTLRQQAGLSVVDVALQAGYAERTVYRWETGEAPARKAVLEMLRSCKPASSTIPLNPRFTFVDLFAGIGGLRRGFEQIGGKCVFTCERDKYSRLTYRANFPSDDHPIAEDIREVEADQVVSHDLLLAGFPCQPFSIAGVSKKNALHRPHGFACEAQGTLFYDVARLLGHHRPKEPVIGTTRVILLNEGTPVIEGVPLRPEIERGGRPAWISGHAGWSG